MILYAYSDETEFKKSDSDIDTIVGTGVLITKERISESLILECLQNLKNDKDINSIDQKTLKNGFFHASQDSKNAHSHLCVGINKNISACFIYSYYNQKCSIETNINLSIEDLNRQTLTLSALELFRNKIDKVVLTIENRSGFSEAAAKEWLKRLYNQLLKLTYNQPTFITYYPRFEIVISSKKEPGLQITDFILWALNRNNTQKPDAKWAKRLNFKTYMYHSIEDSPESGGTYFLNSFSFGDEMINYPYPLEKIESDEEFYDIYITIEYVIRQLCEVKLPTHVEHFFCDLQILKAIFDKKQHFETEDLQLLCSTFIKLFDTLPIYHEIEEEKDWKKLLKAKKLAGQLLHQSSIWFNMCIGSVLRWRYKVLTEHKDFWETLDQ